jgi:hypothetical protein
MMSLHWLVDPNISVISRKEIIFHDHFALPVRIRFPQVQPGQCTQHTQSTVREETKRTVLI